MATLAIQTKTDQPRDHLNKMCSLISYHVGDSNWTKSETVKFFENEWRTKGVENRYVLRSSTNENPESEFFEIETDGKKLSVSKFLNDDKGNKFETSLITLSFFRVSTRDRINHLRIYVNMLKGFSNGPGFKKGKTFQTISEFLIYQLGSHGQDWGHLLVPYGYEPEGIQIPEKSHQEIQREVLNIAIKVNEMSNSNIPIDSLHEMQNYKEEMQIMSRNMLELLQTLVQAHPMQKPLAPIQVPLVKAPPIQAPLM